MELSKKLIQDKLKQFLKQGDKLKLTTTRSIISAITNEEKQTSNSVVDSNKIISIIESLIKQRKQAIELYQSSNRKDLAEKEQKEVDILKEFLPEQLSAEEVTHLVKETINRINAAGIKDMGKVMSELKPQLQGRADMSDVSKQVKQCLTA
mgnify:CR=1 FL=1